MTDLTEDRKSSIPGLHLLHGLEDYRLHFLELLKTARQRLVILSSELDHLLFSDEEICDEISRLARRHRQADVRILVKNTQPLATHRHQLIQLQRKLPSKINLKKLLIEPKNNSIGYMIADAEIVLVKNDDNAYEGFINYEGRSEARHFLEEFDFLWQGHSEPDPQFRDLNL